MRFKWPWQHRKGSDLGFTNINYRGIPFARDRDTDNPPQILEVAEDGERYLDWNEIARKMSPTMPSKEPDATRSKSN